MEKTYKCKNGHKFRREEAINVTCPSCNEYAEPVKWKTVDEFADKSFGLGLKKELGYIVNTLRGK